MNTSSSVLKTPKRIILFAFLSQLCVGVLFIFLLINRENTTTLRYVTNLTNRIHSSIHHTHSGWNLSQYIADPQTPHPSGSGGFSDTLYIITSDGFVIERHLPIAGYFDSTQYQYLLNFKTMQLVEPIPGETWQVRSKVVNAGQNHALLLGVAVYHPERFHKEVVVKKIESALQYLSEQLNSVQNDNLKSVIDVRNIDYDVSFEIVSNENKILLNNGRMPTYIDKSRFFDELRSPHQKTTYDKVTDKLYMTYRKEIRDSQNQIVGFIITAKPLNTFQSIISQYGLEIVLFLSIQLCLYVSMMAYARYVLAPKNIRRLEFDESNACVRIDDRTIPIPVGSIQYQLCQKIFSQPFRAYTSDEIFDHTTEMSISHGWRKAYDAMVLLNKKTIPFLHIRLVQLQDKQFLLSIPLRMHIANKSST